jgi:hypothetical protein
MQHPIELGAVEQGAVHPCPAQHKIRLNIQIAGGIAILAGPCQRQHIHQSRQHNQILTQDRGATIDCGIRICRLDRFA